MEGKILTLKDGHKLYVVKKRYQGKDAEEYDSDGDTSWIGELIEDEDSGNGWGRDGEIPEDYAARYSDRYWAFSSSEVEEVESDPIYEIY